MTNPIERIRTAPRAPLIDRHPQRRRRVATLALTVCAAAVALPSIVDVPHARAEQHPVALAADGRIKRFSYNEHTVYRLDTHTNFITTVQFGPAESVQSI